MDKAFPRISGRVLFWTTEGRNVAPSRARSYGFCRLSKQIGIDAEVIAFWDHLAAYKGLPPYPGGLNKKAKLLFRAMWRAVQSGSEIIIVQRPTYDYPAIVALKAFFGKRLKIWYDVDDWIFDYGIDSPFGTITFQKLLPLYIPLAEGCIVSSVRLRDEMARHFKRVEIIPTYPDADLFRSIHQSQPGNPRVVFSWIGTLFIEENVEDVLFLVRALSRLNDKRIVLEIVGGGARFEETREKANAIAGSLELSFTGWKDPSAMPEYISGIDVGLYCLTRHNDFNMSKSPTKLFEYMACGKAVVTTRFGEAARFVEDGVTGFLATDLDEFTERCGRLIADPELRKKIGVRAREKIEKEYNLRRAAEQLKQILALS